MTHRPVRVLIAGCGYVGTALGKLLARRGHAVWGLRRRPEELPAGIVPLRADLTRPETLRRLPAGFDFVFYTAAADSSSPEHYQEAYIDGLTHLLTALSRQTDVPRRLFLASSTRVYAQRCGEWVDENSPAEPKSEAGRKLLQAERTVREAPLAGTIVRFGGIYGPGRSSLIDRLLKGQARIQQESPRYVNRIHRDDCAGALAHLMELEHPEELYVGVDCEPAPQWDVIRWVASELGLAVPVSGSSPGPAPRRRADNKRCRNTRLLSAGYRLLYPSYREGYGALIREGGFRIP